MPNRTYLLIVLYFIIFDYFSSALQLAAWNKLEKTIFALINKVNAVNVGTIKKQLLQINILRGRGVFCQYIMKAQSKSTNYTHVYATLVAAINIEVTNCLFFFFNVLPFIVCLLIQVL